MKITLSSQLGSITRYPVKSFAGEGLSTAYVSTQGIEFDRQYAIVDAETGRLANAKNAKQWPAMYFYRSRCLDTLLSPVELPQVRITLPDGSSVDSSDQDASLRLSRSFNRLVQLKAIGDSETRGAWNSFVDIAPIHLVTTASLGMLNDAGLPLEEGAIRFRPNLVIDTPFQRGFAENRWIGKVVSVGSVRLRIIDGTRRCARITLRQPTSAKNPGLFEHILKVNDGKLGVYAEVLKPGFIQVGDAVILHE